MSEVAGVDTGGTKVAAARLQDGRLGQSRVLVELVGGVGSGERREDRRAPGGCRAGRRGGPEHVGIGIANAIGTFDPDEVLTGGGGGLAGELVLQPATRAARRYGLPRLGSRTTIRPARDGVAPG
jgi:predicted NBD/HSP70 family sugar kinase